jgi:hypothetical protein
MATSRRTFCSQAAATLLSHRLLCQSLPPLRTTTHPDVASIDHDRILHAATEALTKPPTPLTSLPAPHSPGTTHDFYSEATDYWPDPANSAGPYVLRASDSPNPAAFTAHRDALLNLCLLIPSLTAAFVLTKEQRYAQHAVAHLRSWFLDPASSMTPNLIYAQTIPPAKTGRFEGIVEAVHLAEVVQCLPFLANSEALPEDELGGVKKWFGTYFAWLNESRQAGLARDDRSHHGTSWLLQAAAIAKLREAVDDGPLTTLRHQYQKATIRAQITADGTFPHELTTENPYRNSLFNLDMLGGICHLLSTRFEDAWSYELQDGPGMRSAVARHYPYILDRGKWPYRADAVDFNALPIRPPSLLFAARAYNQPQYAELWQKLPPDPKLFELQRTFPIRQPLLWVTRASR